MRKVKVYGSDNTKENRLKLMEILRERMMYHKDKFHAEIIYNELAQLEVKKNGRIEHADNGHDDQIFSYLWALYVWYHGKNVKENWHLNKGELKTDEEFEEIEALNSESVLKDIGMELVQDVYNDEEDNVDIQGQIKAINSKVMLRSEFDRQQAEQSDRALKQLLNSNEVAKRAYQEKYHIPDDDITDFIYDATEDINSYYTDDISNTVDTRTDLQKAFDSMMDLR